MNKYVRAFFLPIMLLAGVFTSILCISLYFPIALCHWYKERELTARDLQKDAEYIRAYHASLKE